MRILISALVIFIASFSSPFAQVQKFQAGTHYVVSTPLPGIQGKEVRVFCTFDSPHCYRLQPVLSQLAYSLPRNVNLVHTPVSLNQRSELLAKTHYVMEILSIYDRNALALYDHIHKDGKTVNTQQDAIKFLTGQGANASQVRNAFNSFALISRTREAAAMFKSARLTGVPGIIVNGKYQVILGSLNNPQELPVLLNYLAQLN